MLALTGAPLGYLAVALCCRNPIALDLQDKSLHRLEQIKDGMGQLITLVSGLGSCRVGQPTNSSLFSLPE